METRGLPRDFDRRIASSFRNRLNDLFLNHYLQAGAQRGRPVAVSSAVDPSVLFIGSSISVLKPYILEQAIPVGGIALAQPSLRVHNANRLLTPDFNFEWGGFFTNIAVLAPVESVEDLFIETLGFFVETVGFSPDDILLRVSAADEDLERLCLSVGPRIRSEVGRETALYYRHHIGIDGIVGRNFNVALRFRDGFKDVGNFIVFEDTRTKYRFMEVGFGDTTILRSFYSLEHVMDCFAFSDLGADDVRLMRLWEDIASVSTLLYREGMRRFDDATAESRCCTGGKSGHAHSGRDRPSRVPGACHDPIRSVYSKPAYSGWSNRSCYNY